jgi:FtsZ-binding cell division protein ZapB
MGTLNEIYEKRKKRIELERENERYDGRWILKEDLRKDEYYVDARAWCDPATLKNVYQVRPLKGISKDVILGSNNGLSISSGSNGIWDDSVSISGDVSINGHNINEMKETIDLLKAEIEELKKRI